MIHSVYICSSYVLWSVVHSLDKSLFCSSLFFKLINEMTLQRGRAHRNIELLPTSQIQKLPYFLFLCLHSLGTGFGSPSSLLNNYEVVPGLLSKWCNFLFHFYSFIYSIMKRKLSEWVSNYPAPSSGISLKVRNRGTQTWFQSTFASCQQQSQFEKLLTYPKVLQALTWVKYVNAFLIKTKDAKFLLNTSSNC